MWFMDFEQIDHGESYLVDWQIKSMGIIDGAAQCGQGVRVLVIVQISSGKSPQTPSLAGTAGGGFSG